MTGSPGTSLEGTGPVVPCSPELKQRSLQQLNKFFGFKSFRPNQYEAVEAALQGHDSFILMSTGSGKSLCYCLPPLVADDIALTVIISPLIALMEDQVASLKKRGISAGALSSALEAAHRRELLEDLQTVTPQTRLLFVTPEYVTGPGGLALLARLEAGGKLLLFAVDEAHCISSWGHDFRASYRKLHVLRSQFPKVPIMALTATATSRVQADIVHQLRLQDPVRLVSSFNRPNIRYSVSYWEEEERDKECLQNAGYLAVPYKDDDTDSMHHRVPDPSNFVVGLLKKHHPRAAIVYCRSRELVERVAGAAIAAGLPAAPYHAGLSSAERAETHKAWSCRERLSIVVATVAFGMGIDRPDVDLVIHASLPNSLEGYYQESGRAGRDGAPARAILLYSQRDRRALEYVSNKGASSKYETSSKVNIRGSPGAAASSVAVVNYCLTKSCRRAKLLSHFGEQMPAGKKKAAPCCDCCDSPTAVAHSIALACMPQSISRSLRLWDRNGTPTNPITLGGDKLEFETERPGEGLEFDDDVESSGKARGGRNSETVPSSWREEDQDGALAAAAAKRAKREGSDVVDALARAEEAQMNRDRKHKTGALASLLNGSGSTADVKTTSRNLPPSNDLLALLRTKLTSSLRSNPALNDVDESAIVHALMGQLCSNQSSSAVLKSRASNLLIRISKAASLADLGVEVKSEEIDAEGEIPSSVTVLLRQVVQAAEALKTKLAMTMQQEERLTQMLKTLLDVPVSIADLSTTGAGKAARYLQKYHPCVAIAESARDLVAFWKASLGP